MLHLSSPGACGGWRSFPASRGGGTATGLRDEIVDGIVEVRLYQPLA
ncbi:MAG: hypothetical protein KY439_04520 [Actinobacteria bacterium]|nr:hypothetical protein [Actinomycetota bacterium]